MNYEKLIKELIHLRKTRARVRLYMGLLVVASSLLPVAYIVFQVRDFVIGDKGKVFVTATIRGLPTVLKHQRENFTNSIERVGGKFIGEFQRISDRDFPIFEPQLYEELEKVVEHADRRWVVVSKSIDVMAMNHQRAIVEKLNEVIHVKMTDEQVEALAIRYKTRILDRLQHHWHNLYQKTEPSVRRIETNLILLSEKEPDFQENVAPNQPLGVLLEYVGLELQSREVPWDK